MHYKPLSGNRAACRANTLGASKVATSHVFRIRPRAWLLTITAVSLAVTALATHAADFYKWTDDKGVLHYSDTPPPPSAKQTERVRVDKGVSRDVPPDPVAPVEPVKPKDDKPAAEAVPAVVQDTPENRARRCEQARANIELMQSKFQVADAQGHPLDDKQRADRIANEKQASATYCGE